VTRILADFAKFGGGAAVIMVLSENNHRVTSNSAAARGMAVSQLGVLSGKWYWEMLSLTAATAQGMGIAQSPGGSNINEYLGSGPTDWGYFPTGAYWTNAVNVGTGLGLSMRTRTGTGTSSILCLTVTWQCAIRTAHHEPEVFTRSRHAAD
jgi:hypothetical protein